ncbi:PQQ-binding-like beta-propeller repeat protein [Streptomyces sp. NPDC085479]|uniref:outer membrane protein assembly factor BamB family protein n=1 Tax=Streptomyces sp. NPDC085479 TaxID=3365726 RepID=UPI0037D863A6
MYVSTSPRRLVALDSTSGKELWRLEDDQADGRFVPDVTASWHGRIYARASSHTAVALDARTGKDWPAGLDVAPVLVNEYQGLALVGRQVLAYSTGGARSRTTGSTRVPAVDWTPNSAYRADSRTGLISGPGVRP